MPHWEEVETCSVQIRVSSAVNGSASGAPRSLVARLETKKATAWLVRQGKLLGALAGGDLSDKRGMP